MPSIASKPLSSNASPEAFPEWMKYAVVGGALLATGLIVYIIFGPDEGSSKNNESKRDKVRKGDGNGCVKTSRPLSDDPDVNPKHKMYVEELPEDDGAQHTKDALDQALAAKNKGNKYFKGGKYDLAIRCYTEAIEMCPTDNSIDLSTFYQNRAAAHDQLEDLEMVSFL